MTKQYLDKTGLTYFWGKAKDNLLIKPLPYDATILTNMNMYVTEYVPQFGTTQLDNGVYIADENIYKDHSSYPKYFFYIPQNITININDIFIVKHTSKTAYTIGDTFVHISGATLTLYEVASVSNNTPTWNITKNDNYEWVHRITTSTGGFNGLCTGAINILNVVLTRDLYYDDGTSGHESVTFPIGTIFFWSGLSSTRNIALTPDGDMYSISSVSGSYLNGHKVNIGGGEANVIDSISVNGAALTPDANKNVDIPIAITSTAPQVDSANVTISSEIQLNDYYISPVDNKKYPIYRRTIRVPQSIIETSWKTNMCYRAIIALNNTIGAVEKIFINQNYTGYVADADEHYIVSPTANTGWKDTPTIDYWIQRAATPFISVNSNKEATLTLFTGVYFGYRYACYICVEYTKPNEGITVT